MSGDITGAEAMKTVQQPSTISSPAEIPATAHGIPSPKVGPCPWEVFSPLGKSPVFYALKTLFPDCKPELQREKIGVLFLFEV